MPVEMSPKLLSILTFLVISLLFLMHPFLVSSQAGDELQPDFNNVIIKVHRAESAGATANEVSDLVVQLNKALELNQAANQLTGPNEAPKREAVLSQLNETLNSLQGKAALVEATASRRTSSNRIIGYVSGVIAALVGAVVCALGIIFWKRYRTKRTFQMRVIPK